MAKDGGPYSRLRAVDISFPTTEGVSEQDGGSTLQRAAVTREDSGTYMCWAENRVGRVQAVSFVHVKGRMGAHEIVLHRLPVTHPISCCLRHQLPAF